MKKNFTKKHKSFNKTDKHSVFLESNTQHAQQVSPRPTYNPKITESSWNADSNSTAEFYGMLIKPEVFWTLL